MNDRDQNLFEAELRRLKPARPPGDFMARLAAAPPIPAAPAAPRFGLRWNAPAWWWFRRLAPVAASAALIVALTVSHWAKSSAPAPPRSALTSTPPIFKPGDVEIDRQLVAAYDAVASLPDGEPVRLLCREWRDQVTLRDPARGIVIERQTPRLEVVPVRFETY